MRLSVLSVWYDEVSDREREGEGDVCSALLYNGSVGDWDRLGYQGETKNSH